MAKKQSKNLQRVQDMLDDKYDKKIQSGYTVVEETHKVGDKWFDSDGREWEQKNGYRTNITKLASRGIVDHRCSECEKYIIKPWDKEIFKFNDRCYYCQINFEAELKGTGKFDDRLKKAKKDLKVKEKEKNGIKKSLKSKKKALEEIKKQREQFGVERKPSDEAAEFLKKYAKKKK